MLKIYEAKVKKDKRNKRYQSDKGEFLVGGSEEVGLPYIDIKTLNEQKVFKEGKNYFKYQNIEDQGFNRWEGAYDKTASFIYIMATIFSFKFYRLTYSNLMEKKQFLVLY